MKCIKTYDKEKLVIFDEAEKSCLQTENGSSLLKINSEEEQEFISEFFFKTNKKLIIYGLGWEIIVIISNG